MIGVDNFAISWKAPIVPSTSMGGIPLGVSVELVDQVLSRYIVSEEEKFYRFEDSPLLLLKKQLDLHGGGSYVFYIKDKNLTNWSLYFESPDHAGVDLRAFSVIFRAGAVHAIKVWQFERIDEGRVTEFSYQGRLPRGVMLGDRVSNLLQCSKLEYDSAEEWFYTDQNYGGLEVSGFGGSLIDEPGQVIMTLAVISG
jgi:hypothetical protein